MSEPSDVERAKEQPCECGNGHPDGSICSQWDTEKPMNLEPERTLDGVLRRARLYGVRYLRDAEVRVLLDSHDRLTRELREAQAIVANVNNSMFGSHGYFTTPDCVVAVEKLKALANRRQAEVVDLRAKLDATEARWNESITRGDEGWRRADRAEARLAELQRERQ